MFTFREVRISGEQDTQRENIQKKVRNTWLEHKRVSNKNTKPGETSKRKGLNIRMSMWKTLFNAIPGSTGSSQPHQHYREQNITALTLRNKLMRTNIHFPLACAREWTVIVHNTTEEAATVSVFQVRKQVRLWEVTAGLCCVWDTSQGLFLQRACHYH